MAISVTVKTLDSQNHQFEGLDDDITVQAFKEHIASTVNVPADRQRLIYCGRVLKDDKKLSEYDANGKVIHLVQRNPNIPQDGPDNLSASEARARGASPARGRAHHHHIHIQQQPGYIPSMTFRLNIARELLTRANRIVARLENPSAPPPPQPTLEPTENVENSNPDPSQIGALPAQVAQVFQSAVNSAMQSMRGGNLQQGHIEMSVSIDQNGQIISQSSSSDNNGATAATASATSTTTSTSAPSTAGSGTSRSASGRQLQHPPLSELADTMDELQRTEDRFRPFRQRMYDLLRNDPAFESDQGRIEAQQLFNRSTEVMHLLSHVQHALSDAVVNMNQDRPRHIRASPLVIQSRSTIVQSVPMVSNTASSGSSGRGTNQEQTARPTSSEASASAAAASPTTTSADVPRNIAEVEVNVEPIIVGIEVDSDGSRASGGNPQAAPAFMQGLMQMLNGSGGGTLRGGVGLPRGPQSRSSNTNASGPASGGQDSQAAPPRVGGGAQTQSTTSTNTRSSAHVHVAPLGPMSFNFPHPMMMSGQPSFDPLLPCNSHHTNPLNRRTRHPAGPQAPQRPRSASMPPRNASANRAQQPTGGEANSARSSPAHARRPTSQQRSNFDFEITAHADIMPMIMTPQGMMNIGTPTRMMQQPPPSRATVSSGGSGGHGGQDRMEPSLAQLLAALQGEAASGPGDRSAGGGNVDLGMFNVVMGVMNEINGNSNRTVSEFLERIPDYNYREGESLVTDLLMLIARNTSFADLVNILQGSSDLNHLQTPLREFIRRYILTPPNEDEEHDIDAAVLYLVDSHFAHLEAMAAEANVQADIDFAETVHSFLTANLSSLAETILKTPSGNFGLLFRQRSVSFLARLTTLCLRCFTDGHASLERVIRNRIEAISGDYGATLRDFVLSAAVAHFRNYLASLEATSAATRLQNDQDVEQYLVRTGPDADQRRAARRRRLTQHQQAREEETFVTPRSSPTRATPSVEPPTPEPLTPPSLHPPMAMDVDNDPKEIVEPPSQQHSTFPDSLSNMGSMESTINVGSQPWHGTLPANWVPIVARDVNRQNDRDAIQAASRPLSDALLSTQSAKRRRLASKSKPEGNVEQLIADTLHSAIRVSGAQPLHAVEEVVQEASGHDAVQQSLGQDIQKSLSRRVANDPDFDSKKFPNAAKNLSAKKS